MDGNDRPRGHWRGARGGRAHARAPSGPSSRGRGGRRPNHVRIPPSAPPNSAASSPALVQGGPAGQGNNIPPSPHGHFNRGQEFNQPGASPGNASPQKMATTEAFSKADEAFERAQEKTHWTTWPELTVRLPNVPKDIQTWDLYDSLSGFGGKIVFVEIVEDSRGNQFTARVRFSPIPKRPFWDRLVEVRYAGNKVVQLQAKAHSPRRVCNGKVQSPVDPQVFHQAVTELRPESLEFGVMLDDDRWLPMKKLMQTKRSNREDGGNRICVDVLRKKIVVFFDVEMPGKGTQSYKFSLDFSTLGKVFWSNLGDGSWALLIPMDHPPAYFWKRENVKATFANNPLMWSEGSMWYRVTDIRSDTNSLMRSSLSLRNESEDPVFINIGRWTTFRFVFRCNVRSEQDAMRALVDYNIKIDTTTAIRTSPPKASSFWDVLDAQADMGSASHTHSHALALLTDTASSQGRMLPFVVRYQLEVCISRRVFSEYTLGCEFLQRLQALDPEHAAFLLEGVADAQKRVSDPLTIFDQDLSDHIPLELIKSAVPHYCAVTRKVLVTPTAIYFTSPAPEVANRVLRKFRHVQDRFLRVQFSGELLEGRVSSRASSDQEDEVYKRVYRVLTQGIRIGDRHYRFLAFGNSQVRENSTYFFAPTEHITCDSIRGSMGHFHHIKSVAKFAARMGQCFSTTREVRAINVPNIHPIPDIENTEGYCFTDGVGKVSKFLAEMVVGEMGLDVSVVPSAIQFRMGGCKGVLAVWPEAKQLEVHVRKSQQKFLSEFNGLEVIRCARFAGATLNRQTVTILACLGVTNEAIVRLLDNHLEKHRRAELSTRDAISLLREQVDENQTTVVLAETLAHGFREPSIREPFICTMLDLWKIWSLKLVKEKARIPVDKGAFVLGCVDETGSLRGHSKATEGSLAKDVNKLPQIFLQITDVANPQESMIITGICIVGRNPSLHPGDIRVVEAVDVPGLRHLRDVVVFPIKGDRDVPSMLSGGDLDGDDFFVIWEPSLLPPVWNYPPMDHMTSKARELDRDVTVDDLCQFFVKYMKNDILPTVALAHLALADHFVEGARSEKCLALAQLHSKAVDYVKTGDPAEMDKSLRPRQWPHFMEKRGPKEMTYRSEKALGVIYDKVQSVKFDPMYTQGFDKRILAKCPNDSEVLKAARQIKSQYDTAMRRVMGQREIATEFEIWSGFVLSKPRIGSGYKLQEDIGREYASIKETYRDMCYKAAGGHSKAYIDPFVAAMYKVTEEEMNIAQDERRSATDIDGDVTEPRAMDAKSMPLISFPWIFHWVLCRLATGTSLVDGIPGLAGEEEPERPLAKRGKAENWALGSGALGVDDVAHLNDGRILHRGEVLDLFSPGFEEGDSGEQVYEPYNFLDGVTRKRTEPSSDGPKDGVQVVWNEGVVGEKDQEAGSLVDIGLAEDAPTQRPARKARIVQNRDSQGTLMSSIMEGLKTMKAGSSTISDANSSSEPAKAAPRRDYEKAKKSRPSAVLASNEAVDQEREALLGPKKGGMEKIKAVADLKGRDAEAVGSNGARTTTFNVLRDVSVVQLTSAKGSEVDSTRSGGKGVDMAEAVANLKDENHENADAEAKDGTEVEEEVEVLEIDDDNALDRFLEF